MSDNKQSLLEFEEMLFLEWSNPDDDTVDPIIIIQNQTLARRVAGGITCHVTVISEKWPTTTPEEREDILQRIGTRADPRGTKNCTKWIGFTQEEANAAGWDIIFAHPKFDSVKPHDSEHFTPGATPVKA